MTDQVVVLEPVTVVEWVEPDGVTVIVASGVIGTAPGGGGGAVDSVNGQTGAVTLDAGDVSADPAGTGATEAADAVTAHEAAANPHPTYLTAAEGDAAYDALGAAAAAEAASDPAGTAAAAISAHEGAANPHPTYLTAAEGDAAYSALGHNHSGTYDPAGTAASAVSSHESDTTSVHGIADTSALETTSGAQAKVDAHTGDTSDAHDATAISITDTGTYYAGSEVEAALQEVGASLSAVDVLTDLVAGVTVPPGWGQRWKAGPGKPATQIEDTGGISNSDTSIGLADPGTFVDSANRVARIEDEDIFVTAGENTQTITATRGVNGTTAASHSDATHVLLSKVRKVMIWGDSIAQGTYPLGADAWANRAFRVLARRYGGQIGTTWPLYRNTSNISQAGSQEWVVTNGTPLGDTNSSTLSPGGAISFTTGSGNGGVWTRPAGVNVAAFDIVWVDGGASWDDWSYSIDGGSTWVTNTVPSTSPANPALKRTRVVCDNPTTIRVRAANSAGTSQVCVLPYECLITYSTDPQLGVTEGMSLSNIGWNGQTLRGQIGARTVTDAVVTNGDATVTSATATFVSGDAGSAIWLNGVAYTILSRTSATEIELSTTYAGSTGTGVRASIFQTAGVADHLRIFDGDVGSIVPDLLVMGPWTNDMNYTTGGGNENVDAFGDYLRFVMGRVTPYCDVLMVAPYEQDPATRATTTLQGQYRAMVETVAAEYDAASFNMREVFVAAGYADFAAADAAGFMYDDLHLSITGNWWMAGQLTRLLEVI